MNLLSKNQVEIARHTQADEIACEVKYVPFCPFLVKESVW